MVDNPSPVWYQRRPGPSCQHVHRQSYSIVESDPQELRKTLNSPDPEIFLLRNFPRQDIVQKEIIPPDFQAKKSRNLGLRNLQLLCPPNQTSMSTFTPPLCTDLWSASRHQASSIESRNAVKTSSYDHRWCPESSTMIGRTEKKTSVKWWICKITPWKSKWPEQRIGEARGNCRKLV